MPVSRDALSGSFVAIDRTRVEARVGESDAAVAHIEELLAIPGRHLAGAPANRP